jgi:hypothetical protein
MKRGKDAAEKGAMVLELSQAVSFLKSSEHLAMAVGRLRFSVRALEQGAREAGGQLFKPHTTTKSPRVQARLVKAATARKFT